MHLWSQGGDVIYFIIFGCERHIRKCASIIIIINIIIIIIILIFYFFLVPASTVPAG